MSGLYSRQKGARGERDLCMHLRELNFDNVRRGLCQEEKKDFRPDVLAEWKGREYSFESKFSANKFKWLYVFVDTFGVKGTLRLLRPNGGYVAIGTDPREVLTIDPFHYWVETGSVKISNRIEGLLALKKQADVLVLRINGRKRLYLKYWD